MKKQRSRKLFSALVVLIGISGHLEAKTATPAHSLDLSRQVLPKVHLVSFSLIPPGGLERQAERSLLASVRLNQPGMAVTVPEPTAIAFMLAGGLMLAGRTFSRARQRRHL